MVAEGLGAQGDLVSTLKMADEGGGEHCGMGKGLVNLITEWCALIHVPLKAKLKSLTQDVIHGKSLQSAAVFGVWDGSSSQQRFA